jgi:hypothetical protein
MGTFTKADLTYIRSNFVTLEELCSSRVESVAEIEARIQGERLPRPSYVLEDGTGMFPPDYFRLAADAGGFDELSAHFAARHRAAVEANGGGDGLEEDWRAYLEGAYGICLREVTPENIVRKTVLVSSLCELLMLPSPRSGEWRRALREQVDELDALEREFAPDYDRADHRARPPTRDLLIEAARERYPELFHAGRAPTRRPAIA